MPAVLTRYVVRNHPEGGVEIVEAGPLSASTWPTLAAAYRWAQRVAGWTKPDEPHSLATAQRLRGRP
jgi:hypothetical protein